MNVHIKKYTVVFFAFAMVWCITGENFLIKKTKQLVVAVKDRCLETFCTVLTDSSHFFITSGVLIQSVGQLQKELMSIVQEEAEQGNSSVLAKPDAQLQAIEQGAQKVARAFAKMTKIANSLRADIESLRTLLIVQDLKNNNKKI